MEECRLTAVCLFNKKDEYDRLASELSSQTIETELLGIDNSKNQFSSCSSAFNYALKSVMTPYVIFLHQDIVCLNNTVLEQALSILESIKDNDIIGVAGSKENVHGVYTNLSYGDGLSSAGNFNISCMEDVQTVDECFFAARTNHFCTYPFDEEVCDGFHLYAVDKCLETIALCGGKVYACDLPIMHKSKGRIDGKYISTYRRISKKYEEYFKNISTTCSFGKASFFGRLATSIWLRMLIVIRKNQTVNLLFEKAKGMIRNK